mgnify:CR=1 FL=1
MSHPIFLITSREADEILSLRASAVRIFCNSPVTRLRKMMRG